MEDIELAELQLSREQKVWFKNRELFKLVSDDRFGEPPKFEDLDESGLRRELQALHAKYEGDDSFDFRSI